MRLDYTLLLWFMIAACSSAHRTSDDGVQAERDAAVPEVDAGLAIAPECIDRVPGEEFCDGPMVRVCIDGTPSTRPCGQGRRCVTFQDVVSCACEPGAVDTGTGCQRAASCAANGCDPLTDCTVVAGAATCGACPAGYGGDGRRGCQPLLSGLVVNGELTPAFAPDVRSYRVKLSSMQEQLSLTPTAPSEAQLEVDGAKLDPGTTWQSPVLSPGAHAITLVLIGPSGVSTRYDLIVER